MIVRLPVSVAFGSDEEFDLRVRLERELATALAATDAGVCAGGEIDASHMNILLANVRDPSVTLSVIKEVLGRMGLLLRAAVLLETCSATDPDDRDRHVIWSGPSVVSRSA
jgi:hypothetical protein